MKYNVKFILLVSIAFYLTNCSSPNSAEKHSQHTYTNALINESSPYLLQHAHNPVDWFPWGDEAIKKAQDEDKLILISVGYAACHWCHVMEHESFEDTAVSKIMNEHFVNIKVDREERPDVDDVYMTACHMISKGSCGWPLNAIALPNGKPVWAGTYFPKKDWIGVLEYFIGIKEKEYSQLQQYAEDLAKGIQNQGTIEPIKENRPFEASQANTIADIFVGKIDQKKGGRVGALKFPMPNNYRYLMQRAKTANDQEARQSVLVTLDEMFKGGIYDHLGGGFARYSTDADWHVPHFEKMLYDNAQLVSLYAQAYKWTGDDQYLSVVDETISFLKRELFDEESGAFYSSLDADSEGEEGKFYVWTKDEIDAALGDQAASSPFYDYYDIKQNGNWEHNKNILRRVKSAAKIAKSFNITEAELSKHIQKVKSELFDVRAQRTPPGLDDKVLTSWNGLMITGLCHAYQASGHDTYLSDALKLGTFISETMMSKEYQLHRNYKDGVVTINGFLDDYATTIEGFIELYESTFDEQWLYHAKGLTDYVIEHFADEKTPMFYYTSDIDPPLIARNMELGDNVIPGSNSMMAHQLHTLGLYFYDQGYLSQAQQMMQTILPQIESSGQPTFYSNWCRLLINQLSPPYEIAVVGPESKLLAKEFLSSYQPQKILLGGEDEGTLELLKEKLQGDETFIYVCQNKVCKYPVRTVKEAIELMD